MKHCFKKRVISSATTWRAFPWAAERASAQREPPALATPGADNEPLTRDWVAQRCLRALEMFTALDAQLIDEPL